jgi:hypothetical protein
MKQKDIGLDQYTVPKDVGPRRPPIKIIEYFLYFKFHFTVCYESNLAQ